MIRPVNNVKALNNDKASGNTTKTPGICLPGVKVGTAVMTEGAVHQPETSVSMAPTHPCRLHTRDGGCKADSVSWS